MRRNSEKRMRRDGALGLCLLASVLFHLFWLVVLLRPAEDPAAPAVTRVFLVSAGQRMPAGAAEKISRHTPFVKKSVARTPSFPSVKSPADHPLSAVGQREVSIAEQSAAVPVVEAPLSSPVVGPTDTAAADGSRSMSRGGGNGADTGSLGRGDGHEPDPELGSSGAAAFLYRAMPSYPPVARRLRQEGTVTLRLAIDADGALREVKVVRGAGYGFTEAALEALARSTFRPAVRGGRPVDSRAVLRVVFALSNR